MAHPLNEQQLTAPLLRFKPVAGISEHNRARVLQSLPALHALDEQWCRLQSSAVEPSISAAPGWFMPMFEHADAVANAVSVIATHSTHSYHLSGIFPLRLQRHRWLAPVPVLTSWANEFFFSGTPLVSADNPSAVITTMLHSAAEDFAARAVLFEKLPSGGQFEHAVTQAAASGGLAIAHFDPFERAGLVTGREFDSWFQDSFQRKKRKEFRRLRARLSEQGNLELITHQQGEPLKQWVNEFTTLENAGWKGRRGTAIACTGHMMSFLSEALASLDRRGDLIFWKLSLDGKPVAMLFAMLSGNRAWLGKIAYDERFARFSPGVLLILDATADLLARPGIKLVDSSAVPDHPMINHLWRDRLAMTDIMVATPGTSRILFKAITAGEHTRRKVRAVAKSAYHRLLKGKVK